MGKMMAVGLSLPNIMGLMRTAISASKIRFQLLRRRRDLCCPNPDHRQRGRGIATPLISYLKRWIPLSLSGYLKRLPHAQVAT